MMSKLKVESNKYPVAKKNTEKLKGVVIPKEVNDNEKHLYHVLLVTSTPNKETMGWDHKASVKKYNLESFSKALQQNTFQRLGYADMIVFHDPTISDKDVSGKKEGNKNAIDTIADVMACETVEEVLEFKTEEETRKTVLDAIQVRIEELDSNQD